MVPPGMSGKRVHVELTNRAIDVPAVRAHVLGDPTFGAVCTFEGTTRNDPDAAHGEVVRLEYEAYEGMACKQMTALAEAAVERWGPAHVAIVHRVGAVAVGEVSVMITVACGHRGEAFEACRWLIDAVKRDVPIWKRDVYADGFVRWVDPPAEASMEA